MVLTKAEKLGYFVRSLERQGVQRQTGETDVQFATRIINLKVSAFRDNFLKQHITMQKYFEDPKEDIDVSDL